MQVLLFCHQDKICTIKNVLQVWKAPLTNKYGDDISLQPRPNYYYYLCCLHFNTSAKIIFSGSLAKIIWLPRITSYGLSLINLYSCLENINLPIRAPPARVAAPTAKYRRYFLIDSDFFFSLSSSLKEQTSKFVLSF